MVITGSRDRDHGRRRARLTFLCCAGNRVVVKGWRPGRVRWRFPVLLDPFFGSTRAASILPSRPPNRAAAARRACQGWPHLRGHLKGLALTGPSTAACLIGSGLEAGGNLRWAGGLVCLTLPMKCLAGCF